MFVRCLSLLGVLALVLACGEDVDPPRSPRGGGIPFPSGSGAGASSAGVMAGAAAGNAAGMGAGAVSPAGAGGATAGSGVAGNGGVGSIGGGEGGAGAGDTGGTGVAGSAGAGTGGVVAGTAGAAAGTGGKQFDPGPGSNNVGPGGVCQRLAEIQCAGEDFCCDAPRDRASCVAEQLSVCRDDGLVDTITQDPITGFDAAHASAALQTMQDKASQCDPTIGAVAASTQGLGGMFKGTRPGDTDCSPGLLPTTAQVAAAAVSCTNVEAAACLPNTNDLVLGQWSCATKSGQGGPCLTDLNCQMGLYCDNPTLKDPVPSRGACAARKPVDSACTAGNECQSIVCVQGMCKSDVQAAYCIAWQQ